LVYGQGDAGGFAGGDGFDRFSVIHAERFLREDTFDGFAGAGGFDQSELGVWRNSDVEDFDGWIIEQLLVAFANS
jgi:hypothetical protein